MSAADLQAGSATLFFVVSVALAIPLYYLLPQLGMKLDTLILRTAVPANITVGLALTFHYYIVDAIVWKRRSQAASIKG